MSTLQDFESSLKEAVRGKRLSASKMNKTTELALGLMENDAKLVAILYKTHKNLHSTCKVSGLYAFDALARAARSYANKHKLAVDSTTDKGNCASFLQKMEGVLDGLVKDMLASDNDEAKEKTKKVLDIWAKANTFSSAVLSRLSRILEGTEKDPVVDTASVPTPPKTTTPPQQSPPPTTPADVQTTLMALLSQAATAVGSTGQTTVNSMSIGQQQVGAIQSALLEQLAQVAPGMTQAPQSFTIGTASTPSTSTNYSVSSAPTADPRSSSHTSVDPRTNGPNGAHNSRFVGPPAPTPPLADKASTDAYVKSFGDSGAGNYHTQVQPPYRGRGDFRGGRGRGRGRWDVRGRFDSTAAPQERNNKSRSQSPPGSRYGAARDEGTLSPSRRDYVKNTLSVETDEFGREIRPDVGDRDIDEPVSTDGNASVTAVEPVKAPISSTIGETSGTAVTALVGMESFNFATFDPTAPTSWEALGNAWQVTNGYVPSQEELMQFVMSAYGQPQQAMQSAGATMDPTSSAGAYEGHNGYNTEKVGWQGPYQGRGRGRGAYRGNDRGRGMGRGNYRNGQDQWGHGGDVYNEPSVAHAPVDEYEVRRS